MKKVISLLLALAMVMSLAACGSGDSGENTTAATTAATEATTEATTQATEAEIDSSEVIGSVEGNTYTNEFLGLTCTLDDSWTILSVEELAELNGAVAELTTDEDLAELLSESGTVQDFYAMAQEGLYTLNITVEDLGLLYGITMSEDDYIGQSGDALVSGLESIGMTDVVVTPTPVTVAGEEHAGMTISASYMGVNAYETIACVKVGNYMATICAASYVEDLTADFISLFEAV